jgi:dTMP kinase
MNSKGFFLVLEGIDGAGTSTQTRILEQYLSERGLETITTNEPWTSFYGKEIRRRLRGETDEKSNGLDFARLFVADSAVHNEQLIVPALKENKIIISDRYRLSSFAYQTTQGISFERIMRLHEAEDLEVPDLTIYFDLETSEALRRISNRTQKKEKFETSRFLREVIDNYKRAIDKKLKYAGQIISIDATLPLETVSTNVIKIFEEFYNK